MLKRLLPSRPVSIFSKKMGRLLKHSKVANPHTVVAGAEWAILSSCGEHKPAKTLAAALDTTWRTMDQPLLRAYSNAPPGTSSKEALSQDYALKLRDPSGHQPHMMVHLDAAFDPETMLRNWDPHNHQQEGFFSRHLQADATTCKETKSE
jgi:hypothetical protein